MSVLQIQTCFSIRSGYWKRGKPYFVPSKSDSGQGPIQQVSNCTASILNDRLRFDSFIWYILLPLKRPALMTQSKTALRRTTFQKRHFGKWLFLADNSSDVFLWSVKV